MTTNQDEKELVARLLSKDEQALWKVYKEYKPVLYGFVARQITDKHVVDELVQDVFMDFLEGLRDFRLQSSIKTYLLSIARNKVIDFIRKKKIKKVIFSALPDYIVEGLAHIVMDDELEKKEVAEKIKSTFATLPHDYEVILRLKYIEDAPVRKIASKLSLTFKATESLLFRARKAFVKAFGSTI